MENISNNKLGKSFEGYVEKCLGLKGWEVTRVPDGCRKVFALGKLKLVPCKSPFDFFACKKNKAIFFDAKTTLGETFPYSAINQHQVKELLKYHNSGFVAGYIINFRQNGTYGFIDAKQLSEVVERGSIRYSMSKLVGKEIDVDSLFVDSKTE